MSLFGGAGGFVGVGSASVRLFLDDSNFQAGLTKDRAEFEGSTTQMSGSATKFGGAAKAGFALAGLAAAKFAADSVKAFLDAQAIAAQTTAVIESTGGAANVTAEDVGNLATAISNLSGIDDEAVQATENLLLTFRGVTNEVGAGNDIFNQATQAIADMATAMNQGAIPSQEQMKTVTIAVGKALNDPIRGMAALGRVGVQFTDQQRKLITTMVETGDVMGAQKVILGELAKEFGGAAKAAGDSAAGQFAKFRNEVENLQEAIGAALVPVLHSVTVAIGGLMPVFQLAVGHIGTVLAAFLGFKAVQFLPGLLLQISLGLDAVGAVGAADAVSSLAANLQALAGPLKVAAVAVPIFQQIASDLDNLDGKVLAIAAPLAGMITDIESGSILTSEWSGTIDELIGRFDVLLALQPDKFAGSFADVLNKDLIPAMHDGQLSQDQWNSVVRESAKVGIDAEGALARYNDAQVNASRNAMELALAEQQATTGMQGVQTAAAQSAFAARGLAMAMRELNDQMRTAWALENQAAGGLIGLASADANAAQSRRELSAAQAKVNTLIANGKQGTAAYTQAIRDRNAAELASIQSQQSLEGQAQSLFAEFRKGNVSLAEAETRLRAQAAAAGLSASRTNELVGRVDALYAADVKLPSDVVTNFSAPGLEAQMSALVHYWTTLNAIPRHVDVFVTTHYSSTTSGNTTTKGPSN